MYIYGKKPIKLEWYIPTGASTPRGWLSANREVSYTFTSPRTGQPKTVPVKGEAGYDFVTLGHYLSYEGTTAECVREGKPFHAHSCVTKQSRTFVTAEDAIAFLEGEARGKVVEHFMHEARGPEHEKDTLRRLRVDERIAVRTS